MQHFDLCVIGSGSGNSLIDERFSDWRVALVDENPEFGGTCLNRGCIPTKMFVVPADYASSVEHANALGVALRGGRVNWPQVRDRVFGRIDPIAASGLEWREQSRNVTVFRARGQFVDDHTLRVGDQTITADRFVIATGSRPFRFDIPGVEDEAVAPFIHTSDTVMRLEKLPGSMVILGGGYIAAEFAHVFSAFGVDVTIINRSERILRTEDADISVRFTELMGERVPLRLNQRVAAIEPGDREGEVIVVTKDRNGIEYLYETECVLMAVGRVPNSDTLNLEATGVHVEENGRIRVDSTQLTSVPHIWAIGDVSSPWGLKHVANHEARVVQHNLLHPQDPIKADHRYVPHAVFSEPQVAAVGATEAQLQEWGRPYVKTIQPYGSVAYGWALEDTQHFVKLLADPLTWHLLGAHIIGPAAPTLIQPLIQAMSFGLDIKQMARGQYWIHPALTEVVENALLSLLNAERPAELEG
ncbi:MAG: mycothione reductase [Propionibacteriaceae bacterium]|nr:mycothione reductase [Propionibacteriaceae bacterium]